ncbi:hypothetical protein BK126_04295 [Paenibacillus sp. FSL H7-0326]|uniref:helix-turn-helix domain-containing protein n=1 Tax=Paenibacillus sp. FSL H7-0326 TaxID=1921144 RepID=UPI00096FBD43|nr:helix-turn-helix transcriptional regulator [Paenibacillus sp. FSL H7-0326]OMC71323.1 hypothetical protein BK126_04295 [Paenibacillus sp. FSL H7-0326]
MNISRGRCLLPNLIKAKGWTQSEYARRVNKHPRVISHYCNNERVMQPEDLYAATLILDCELKDLYEWRLEK